MTSRIARAGVAAEQKSKLVAEIADALVRVPGKKPEQTRVVIDGGGAQGTGAASVLTTG